MIWLLLGLLGGALLSAQTEDPAAKSQRARQFMAAGRFADAAVLYDELTRLVPGNPGLLVNLGLARHMAGQYREAVAPLESALKIQPDIFPALLFLGASRLKLDAPLRAVPPLEKAAALQPDNKETRQMLGEALFSLKRFDDAAAHYRKLTELDPSDPKAWRGLGLCHEALARAAFEGLETTAPESPFTLVLVAEVRASQQQLASAFTLYREALARQPSLRGVHAALAAIYRAKGHAEWAKEEQAREAALPAPDCRARPLECDYRAGRYTAVASAAGTQKTPEGLYWRVKAHNQLAAQAFARLARLPASVENHRLLAEIHQEQKRYLEAAKHWRAALSLAPADRGLEKELAITLHLARDHEAARSILEKLLKAEPGSAELNFLLGDALLNLQQAEKAIPPLEKALSRDPKLLPAHSALARAYLQAGKAEQAVPHLKQALPIDEDGSLHYQLSRAYQGAGESDLARQTLARYQEIRKQLQARQRALDEESQITAPN